jgi:hypothetical protein
VLGCLAIGWLPRGRWGVPINETFLPQNLKAAGAKNAFTSFGDAIVYQKRWPFYQGRLGTSMRL